MREEDINGRIRTLLAQLGLCGEEKGYDKLLCAVTMTVGDFACVGSVTKLLYPELAKRFRETPEQAERSIRHLIGQSWEKGDTRQFERLFGYHRELAANRPTNSEYIAVLADSVCQELRLEGKAKEE